MKFKRLVPVIIVICAVAALVFYRMSTPRDTPTPFKTSFLVFNTQASITVFDDNREHAAKACRDVIGKLTELHLAINAYDETSELSRLNTTATDRPFICSPLLWDILLKSEQAWKLSDGLFDVTVGPLLALWGFHVKQDKLPTQQDIDAVIEHVGFGKLELDREAHSVRFTHNRMRLDFGGIAKGYALQLAMDTLQSHGMKSFLIDLGGNIFRTDTSEGDLIGIRSPIDTKKLIGGVRLHGQCIATSGNYERFRIIQGKRIAHIMNPKNGLPVTMDEFGASVTAITKDPTFSDVFSTTVFVGGEKTARELVALFPGTAFVLAKSDANGKLNVSTVGPCDFIDH
ncbi:MAG: FAD:protein FMN transferase [Victivallales bacterium]|nr:FAD:protein FMN transferase [Victivallales bacterium]